MISREHANRKPHNWLIYKINDHFLDKHKSLFTGVLYDFGAGTSPYKDFFLSHADKYIAVDWAESFHETRADIVANLNEPLPIDSSVADTVVSLSVMEHLHKPQTMLNEAFRVLKSQGVIVLQVPWQWRIHEMPYDFFRYTPYGLEYLFTQAGFTDILVEPQAGFFTMITLKINYFSLKFIRGPKPLRLTLRKIFHIFWFIGQKICPLLDTFDKNWAQESTGYFVTARKP